MSKRITKWTTERIVEFVAWHEQRMAENGYSKEVMIELRRARGRFLSSVAPAPKAEQGA